MMLSTEPPEKYGMMTQRFWTAPTPRQTWCRMLYSRTAAHRAINEGAMARHQVGVVEQTHGLRLFANLFLRGRRRVSFARLRQAPPFERWMQRNRAPRDDTATQAGRYRFLKPPPTRLAAEASTARVG